MAFNDGAGLGLTTPHDSQAFQDAYNKFAGVQQGYGSTDRTGLVQRMNDYTNQFKTLFTNQVGRAPTQDETDKFISQGFSKGGPGSTALDPAYGQLDSQQARNNITQFIGDTFQPEAQQTAQSKLSDLSTQAGSLADQFHSMGKASLGSLADELKGYQTSLFDKLRPQLNLSAQSGGFADSGGQTLQEQGALKDLGNQASGILLPLNADLENQTNAIRYGGMSAPYSLASSFAANQPNAMANAGMGALDFNNSLFNNNLDFTHQILAQNNLYKNISDMQPSMLSTLGQSFANSFGRTSGQNAGDIGSSGLSNSGQYMKQFGGGAGASQIPVGMV